MYLPWGTGFVTLDNTQVMGKSISIRTNIEFMRGSCVHNVYNSDGCVIGSYAGQCGKQVPLLSSDIAAKRAGLVTSAVAVVVGGAAAGLASSAGGAMAASGYTAGAHSGAYGAAMSHAGGYMTTAEYLGGMGARASSWGMEGAAKGSKVMATAPEFSKVGKKFASQASIAAMKHPASVARNGGFTDGSAGMGIQYPYIIVSRPDQNVHDNYGHHYGYPSNIYRPLAMLNGYTEVGDIHLDGIPATEGEIAELDSILKGGVIL